MLDTYHENEVVQHIVAETLNMPFEDIDPNDQIVSYGIDSIQNLAIIGRIRKYYAIADFQVNLANMSINELQNEVITKVTL
ncbi:acyl carrier protein [Shewanella surugensis]|uniref:Acyl carrier protein n=1 Tax=Shewanella surugensis TaxID=212020 RepID=A0ABT0LGK2_9GAMM|nr:acyl carrier protein [Shewanella surugensis]MCL1126823.1 acyl carrier protein [Shewanella surugensis]